MADTRMARGTREGPLIWAAIPEDILQECRRGTRRALQAAG